MAEHLTDEQKTKLMINYLPKSIDVEGLRTMFMQFGDVANVHVVKNTQTNESKGYGFITYENCDSSEKAIQLLNGKQIEDKRLRVAYSTPVDDNNRPKAGGPVSANDVNVYIANLPKNWDEKELTERFETFGPVKHCKILKDASGSSRGAGFVRYENSKMAAAAILEMDDRCPEGGTLPLIVKIADGQKKDRTVGVVANHSGVPGLVLNHSAATASALQAMNSSSHSISHNTAHRFSPYSKPVSHSSINTYTHPGAYPPIGSNMFGNSNNAPVQSTPTIPGYQPPPQPSHQPTPHNHPIIPNLTPPSPSAPNKAHYFCVYIGNLPETTCKSCLLYQLFSPYGAIANVKPMANVNPDAGSDHWFAFVNFKTYADATQAIQALNGSSLNGRSLKVDFKTEKKK